jgi:hypothetical protein
MSTCFKPVPFESFVSYWAGDLDAKAGEELEDHVFACPTCTAMSERIAAVTEKMRSLEPAVIPAARLAELRAGGKRIEDNFVAPGERKRVVFAAQDMIVHHLGGLDVVDVDRVSIVVRSEGTNQIVTEYPSVPFDPKAGEVLIACQRHFAVFPADIAFEVTTFAGGAAKKTTRYVVDHEWALV